jgi:hypothetical protein
MPPRDSKKLHFFGVSSSSGLPEDPRLQEFSVSVPNVSLVQANLGAIADMAARRLPRKAHNLKLDFGGL